MAEAKARRSTPSTPSPSLQSWIWRCWRAPTRARPADPLAGHRPHRRRPPGVAADSRRCTASPGATSPGSAGRSRSCPTRRSTSSRAGRRSPRISLDRPVRGTMDRTTTATGARWVAEHLGRDRIRRRRRDDRFGRQPLARGPRRPRRALRGLRQRPAVRLRRLRTRDARGRHHCRQRPGLGSERSGGESRARAWRPARTSSC